MAPPVCTTSTVAAADEAKTGTEAEAEAEGGGQVVLGQEAETVDGEVVAVEVRGGAAAAEGVGTLAVAGAAQWWGKTDGGGRARRARGLGVGGVEVVTSAKGSGRPRPPRLKRCEGQQAVC